MAADLRTQYLPVVQREAARAGLDWLGDQLGMTIYDEEE